MSFFQLTYIKLCKGPLNASVKRAKVPVQNSQKVETAHWSWLRDPLKWLKYFGCTVVQMKSMYIFQWWRFTRNCSVKQIV